jgi:hypothetical protein
MCLANLIAFVFGIVLICQEMCVISGFRSEAAENRVLGYYAASSGDFSPTFLDNLEP